MCRLLGIVSSEPTEFRLIMQDAPRSLAALSRDHRDGWGIAAFEPPPTSAVAAEHGWRVRKSVACAAEDQDFRRLAVAPGEVVISHIRRRTVGAVSLENTHPFRSGRWVFAHNGTIHERDYLRSSTSARRLAEVRGHTDSELFFAYLLTELDAAGVADAPASSDTDSVLRRVTSLLCTGPAFGAVNFLLSDGYAMYAHRFGRTLYVLDRGPDDPVRESRQSRDGTVVVTHWPQRRRAVLVASEAMTDEPWVEVGEGELLRIDRTPAPGWRRLAA
jgi:predicted glutamine amidotransferase